MKSNSNKTFINCRNNSMFNTNIIMHYYKNGNNINLINNNNNLNNSSNNKLNKNETNYLYFNNEYSKDLLIRRNRVNICEEQSKIIYSRKLMNTRKNREEPIKKTTFDIDLKNEKNILQFLEKNY